MTRDRTQLQMVSPFAGEPYTSSTTDEHGNPAMAVTICEMTPERVPWADGFAGLCTTGFLGLSCYGLGMSEVSNLLVWAVGLVTPLVAHSRLERFFYRTMAKSTEVLFTPTEFRVKTGDIWQVYDRTLTHRFVMMKHDRTREEREQHESSIRRAQRAGKDITPKRYFGDSFHIIFDYLGQRCDIATVYDQKRATAIAARLKACDKVMDTKNKMGEGEVLNPGEQWGNTPGTLPDI